MAAVGYYIFYGLNWIITLLPLKLLYVFSDLIFLFFYYFPGYRRKIVTNNLKNSFPGKTREELTSVEKKFYHHLCDLFIETVKLTHLNNRQLMKRMPLSNPELLNRLLKEGQDIVAILGHYGNWEWLLSLPLFTEYQTVSIYKPLKNKYFDTFMIDHRSRNGMILTPMSSIVREIINLRNKNIRSFYAFLNDQIPPKGDIKYWTNFLNQETAVYTGAERIASKYDMSVVFLNIQKIRRGYYQFTAELLFEHSAGLPEHSITEAHVKRLEEIIRSRPEFWIWSHKRWKHKREPVNG
jgi:KDO2-lipid IV(A) lauroyltransferase